MRAVITPKKLRNRNEASEAILKADLTVALDGTDGAEFVMDERDDKYLILLENTGAANAEAGTDGSAVVTIPHGNGYAGVVDLEVTIPAGSYVFLSLDSIRFKWMHGEDKGKVLVKGPKTVKCAVLVLP